MTDPLFNSQTRERLNCTKVERHAQAGLQGCYFGVDTTNAGDEKIRLSEVKDGGEHERRHRGCSIYF